MTESRSGRQLQFSSFAWRRAVDVASTMLLNGEDGDVEVGGESRKLLHPPVVAEGSGVEGANSQMSGESVLTIVCSAGGQLRWKC